MARIKKNIMIKELNYIQITFEIKTINIETWHAELSLIQFVCAGVWEVVIVIR